MTTGKQASMSIGGWAKMPTRTQIEFGVVRFSVSALVLSQRLQIILTETYANSDEVIILRPDDYHYVGGGGLFNHILHTAILRAYEIWGTTSSNVITRGLSGTRMLWDGLKSRGWKNSTWKRKDLISLPESGRERARDYAWEKASE